MSQLCHISIPDLFSMGNAIVRFMYFELCCKANNWDAAMQTIKLPMPSNANVENTLGNLQSQIQDLT